MHYAGCYIYLNLHQRLRSLLGNGIGGEEEAAPTLETLVFAQPAYLEPCFPWPWNKASAIVAYP